MIRWGVSVTRSLVSAGHYLLLLPSYCLLGLVAMSTPCQDKPFMSYELMIVGVGNPFEEW